LHQNQANSIYSFTSQTFIVHPLYAGNYCRHWDKRRNKTGKFSVLIKIFILVEG
jgi:hypothetical protein